MDTMQVGERFKRWLLTLRLWFVLGLGIKRWLVFMIFASMFLGMGLMYWLIVMHNRNWMPEAVWQTISLQFLPNNWWRIVVPLALGSILIVWALVRLGANLVAPFRRPDEDVVESIYRYQQRRRGPRVVAIGGGTGMPSLLRGLTQYTRNITAIVTVADDGGSSGRLRREYGLLPPGDFRNNIAALARDETLMTQLMQYRFGDSVGGDSQLRGHAFGNLVIAALTGITGSFDEALLAMDKVLAMRGRVMPSTLSNVTLVADVERDGKVERVVGESNIPKMRGRIRRVKLEPEQIRAYPPALKAILQADLIVLGPGSLYTSVLPNLLIPDLAQALRHARAPKVYVCNVAEQRGETDGYDSADHINAIIAHTYPECVDILLANENLSLPSDTGGGQTIFVEPVASEGVRLVSADLVDQARPWRHDSSKVAEAVMKILKER